MNRLNILYVVLLYTTGPFVYTEAINELLPKYFKNHYSKFKDPIILH